MPLTRPFKTLLALTLLLVVSFATLIGSTIGAQAAGAPSPCGLLTAAEAETALGEPLAGPPFRAFNGQPDLQGDTCRFETPSFRSIVLRVEWKNGGQSFALMNLIGSIVTGSGLKGVVTLSDGTKLRGEWDEARLSQCCEFNALRGDQLVVVDFSGSRASVEQAASLADQAVKRLDEPLNVDDAAALASAQERLKARPAIVPACDLVPRDEAETILGGPLAADPEGDESSCNYVWVASGTDYQQAMTLMVTWRGGLSEMRLTQSQMGQALEFITKEGFSADQSQQSDAGPFDETATSMLGVMGVRKDVLLSVETGGMGNDLATALIAAAAKKL